MNARVAAIAVLVAFLAGMVFATFSELRVFLPALLRGALVTIEVAALSFLLMTASAFTAGVARLSPWWPVRWVATAYVEVFRGTSLLVQLFWFFFVLPEFGLTLSPMAAGVLGGRIQLRGPMAPRSCAARSRPSREASGKPPRLST